MNVRRYSSLAIAIAVLLCVGPLLAQQQRQQSQPQHLNPIIAKLAAGKTVYGLQATDFTISNARAVARAPVDFVYLDMEHQPMDFTLLALYQQGMADRGMVFKKGNLQPDVALMARFPQEADESGWVVQQALDLGLMGFIFNGVSSKEQAQIAVKSMRYEPVGSRGQGSGVAQWVWGLSSQEYSKHADLWPLNPNGDLLAMLMIETAEGVKHVDEIMSVPGVGAVFVGAGGDMSTSMQVAPGSPAVEANFQIVLKACKAHNIACAITANTPADVAKRVKEGWRIIRSTVPAITGGRTLLGETSTNGGGAGDN